MDIQELHALLTALMKANAITLYTNINTLTTKCKTVPHKEFFERYPTRTSDILIIHINHQYFFFNSRWELALVSDSQRRQWSVPI